MTSSQLKDLTVLVTGGAGFVGHALLGELLKSEAEGGVLQPTEVRVFDLAPDRLELSDPRLRPLKGDLCDFAAVKRACQGVDLVFHCAALVDWGREPDAVLRAVNEGGTHHVIQACIEQGVPALVHTSTLDVVYSGRPILDGDESLPYPSRFVNTYCSSKAAAEQAVLGANGSRLVGGERPRGATLSTAVVRPASIYGERDPYHLPGLMQAAVARRVMRVGNGTSRSQHVYVGNVAHGHVLAARSLLVDGRAAGQVYFVTDVPAKNFFDFLEPLLLEAGYRLLPPALSVPRGPLRAVAALVEDTSRLLRPWLSWSPTLTRFAVDYVCLDFTVVSRKAARELGYEPIYGEEEAMRRTASYARRFAPTSS